MKIFQKIVDRDFSIWYNEVTIKERVLDSTEVIDMMITSLIGKSGRGLANQFVIHEDNGDITFQSYNSKVCQIRKGGLGFEKIVVFGKDYDYSTTTSRNLNIFLEEMGLGLLASSKDRKEALDRGHARRDEAIAVFLDETL